MIRLQDYTPDVYYKQSRDFQFIGRLFDVVLNSIKTNADMIYDIPSSDAAGSKLIDLLALTLGFKSIHAYSVNQLAAVCSVLPTILRNKGNITALHIVCQTVLTAEGITSGYFIDDIDPETFTLNLYIPQALSDINLLKDLLFYILPAGITVSISRTTGDRYTPNTETHPVDLVSYYLRNEYKLSQVPTKAILERNATEIAGNHTNDRDYVGLTTNATNIKSTPVPDLPESSNADITEYEGETAAEGEGE